MPQQRRLSVPQPAASATRALAVVLVLLPAVPSLARSPAPPVPSEPGRIRAAPGCIPAAREPKADLYVKAGSAPGDGSRERPLASIAEAVRRSGAGATIVVRPGVYREGVTLTRQVKLLGLCGAVVKGSDVWTGFTGGPEGWTKPQPAGLPGPNGVCASASDGRCRLPAQVFVDGRPLRELASAARPRAGQFVLRGGKLILGTDPAGRTVEVSTRDHWFRSLPEAPADGVVIRGFTMLHAASSAQRGGLSARGEGWLVEGNDLSLASSVAIEITGRGTIVRDNKLHDNGQLGLAAHAADGLVLTGNEIWGNNTEDFMTDWEAGGAKLSDLSGVTISKNVVYGNKGRGLWCDTNCIGVRFLANRVHHNYNAGIAYEISSGCEIRDNVVYENGNEADAWGWGAGILIQNSSGCEVAGNVVAWNDDGIAVIEQDRGPYLATDNLVRNNVIASASATFQLAWLSDKRDPYMFEPVANNRARDNRYLWDDERVVPWEWDQRPYYSLAGINATPGEQNSRRLSPTDLSPILKARGVPLKPEDPASTPVSPDLRRPPERWSRPKGR